MDNATHSPIRNRVVEMRPVRAGDLSDHLGNWRVHPLYQKRALEGRLRQTGITDALKAYHSPRAGGALVLIDGHLRKADDPDTVWPVLILDLTDEEADDELAFHAPMASWAETNPLALQALIDRAITANEAAADARDRLASQIADQVAVARRALGDPDAPPKTSTINYKYGLAPSVKVTIAIGDDLETVERALKATGIQNRGAALGYICNHFLHTHEAGNENTATG